MAQWQVTLKSMNGCDQTDSNSSELVRDFMAVLVTCTFDEGAIVSAIKGK